MIARRTARPRTGEANMTTIALLIVVIILLVYTILMFKGMTTPFNDSSEIQISVGGAVADDGHREVQIRVVERPADAGKLYYQINDGRLHPLGQQGTALTLHETDDFPENATITIIEQESSGMQNTVMEIDTSALLPKEDATE